MALKIDARGYSPAVIDQIVDTGGDCKSFQHAARRLKKLARLSIAPSHVATVSHQIGGELAAVRDRQSELHRFRQLPADPAQTPVPIACVEVDGGRLYTRAAGQSRGVHQGGWKEPKIGVLWRMTGETFAEDPHPELPRCFEDPDRVDKLMKQLHADSARPEQDGDHEITLEEIAAAAGTADPESPRWQPRRVFRTCVATMRDVHGFGPLVAAEAQQRGFYQAERQVFVGDGQEANWTVHRLHFPHFTAVTDFMHAVSYVYQAARAMFGKDFHPRYLNNARLCWRGQVSEIIAELSDWLSVHPLPEGALLKEIDNKDPRKIVHQSLTYLQHNQGRMDYASYRQQGLPVTSSLVESLIKEFNWRMKGTEKSWNRTSDPGEKGAESMLQIRAALLCDDNRLEKYILNRPGSPFVRRNSLKPATAAG